MSDVSITDLIAGLRSIAESSVFLEYMVEEDVEAIEAAIAGLESVTVPTENERALAILTAHGFHDPKAVLEAVNTAIIEDRSFTTREGVSHELWSMGGWIKHKGCPNNPKHGNADAEYENGCKTCESYLLAVADALLATRLPVPVEPEYEYGFSADGGPVVERAFGIVPFETADAARHTGSKWFEETLDIVRRTKATPAGEWEATQ